MLNVSSIKDENQLVCLLDSNVLLNIPNFFDVFVKVSERKPIYVITRSILNEVDGLKKSPGDYGYQAREASRLINDAVKNKPQISKGITDLGTSYLVIDRQTEQDPRVASSGLPTDEVLIEVTREYAKEFGKDSTILITMDRNLSTLAASESLPVYDPSSWTQNNNLQGYSNLALPRSMPFSSHSETAVYLEVSPLLGISDHAHIYIDTRWGYRTEGRQVVEYMFQYREGEASSPLLVISASEQKHRISTQEPPAYFHISDEYMRNADGVCFVQIQESHYLVVLIHQAQTSHELLPESFRRNKVALLQNAQHRNSAQLISGSLSNQIFGLLSMSKVSEKKIHEAWNETTEAIFKQLAVTVEIFEKTPMLDEIIEPVSAYRKLLITMEEEVKTQKRKRGSQSVIILFMVLGLFAFACMALFGAFVILLVVSK